MSNDLNPADVRAVDARVRRRTRACRPAQKGGVGAGSAAGHFSGSKITAPVLGWVEDSVIRSDSPDVGAGESFSTCVDRLIVW